MDERVLLWEDKATKVCAMMDVASHEENPEDGLSFILFFPKKVAEICWKRSVVYSKPHARTTVRFQEKESLGDMEDQILRETVVDAFRDKDIRVPEADDYVLEGTIFVKTKWPTTMGICSSQLEAYEVLKGEIHRLTTLPAAWYPDANANANFNSPRSRSVVSRGG